VTARPAPARPSRGGLVAVLIVALVWWIDTGQPASPHRARPAGSSTRSAGTRPSAAGPPMAARAVAYARSQLGKPYVWGGNGPEAFDCSGLAGAAWRAAGLRWPDLTAAGQWRWLHDRGGDLARSQLQPGDLVFYAHDTGDWRSIHHVGLYVGAGWMVEAPYSGALVRQVPLRTRGWFGAARPSVKGGR
jgi:cell wall-associated NlpC family hydrolase